MSVTIPALPNAVTLKNVDQLENQYETNITKGFGVGAYTYNQVDTIARAINALSSNTYSDSIVEMSKSVNDALAEG